jgi:uncharacterized protein involved in outer membrane biogenesis
MKFFKYSILAFFLLVAAAAVYVATLDLNTYKDTIATQVRKATGRDLTIAGDLRVALSLVPTLAAEGVSLANAEWGTAPHLVRVGRFEVRLALLPLLSRQVTVQSLHLIDTEIALETHESGRGNWDFSDSTAPKSPGPAAGPLPAFSLEHLLVQNARLSFRDADGKTTRVSMENLALRAHNLDAPLEIEARAAVNDVPVNAGGTLGSVNELLKNKSYPIDLTVVSNTIEARISGSLTEPLGLPQAVLSVALAVPSLADLNSLTGASLPPIGPLALNGSLHVPSGKQLTFDPLSLTLPGSDLSGRLAIDLHGDRPVLQGNIKAGAVDLRPFQGSEPAPKKKGDRMFSAAPLPLAALKAVDADLQLAVGTLRSTDSLFENVGAALKLQQGRLSLSPLTARLAGGDIRLTLQLDGSAEKPPLEAELAVKQLVLGDLPKLRAEKRLEGGKTDVALKGRGRGRSMAEIAGSWTGSLLVQVGPGRIPNSKVDLAGADFLFETFSRLNPLSSQEPYSDLECAVLNFSIKDGMATSDRGIAMQTRKMTLVGSGAVNLKTEQLDLGIRPYAREGAGLGLGSIAGAARVGGTLAEPKPVIDAANVLKTGVSAGAAVATFGLSTLAQGMFDRSTADPRPCDTALGKAPATTTTTAKQTETKSETQTVEKSSSPVKSATDAVKGVFDNLFGR